MISAGSQEIPCTYKIGKIIQEKQVQWKKREKEKVGKNMRNIVLISHGELAEGMHSVVRMIAGDRKEVYSICLKTRYGCRSFLWKNARKYFL